jgi:hypothetical protein
MPIDQNRVTDDRGTSAGRQNQHVRPEASAPRVGTRPAYPTPNVLARPAGPTTIAHLHPANPTPETGERVGDGLGPLSPESVPWPSEAAPAVQQLTLDLWPGSEAAVEDSIGASAGRKRRGKRGGVATTAAEQAVLPLDDAAGTEKA